MKKRLSLILLITLVSCSNNYQELTNDNKQYYNYQLNYYVGNINELSIILLIIGPTVVPPY